ncbi:TetR/AcrR family transcriptional regulator [Streptomyces spongiae]|uniref:TetR/AcrR family transcriptional regulator n=1 Tax=Streptomyces spongiae TaxID=565072 RepID=A0A5N8X988_9ACTN|nr:TetR/AcrR family transcriptional regulator [Streptomyces spongiae]MPY56002.1 TetR/AcrR family transcriptional regulator [Streptomyces spongiae]
MSSVRPSNRFERRRAETRRALICAARELLAEAGDASASIQAIADRADVGLGSFYNHFESKAELFDAAVADALKEFGQVIDEQLAGTEDPAELMAGGFRLVARMADSHPELMCILRHRGLSQIHSDRGLAPSVRRDVQRGIEAGRFAPIDPIYALSGTGGALLSLVELRFSRPDLDGEEAASNLAEITLRMLGVPLEEAHEVAWRPLPAPRN